MHRHLPATTRRRNAATTNRKQDISTACFAQARPSVFLSDTRAKRDKMGHQQLYWSHPRKFGQGSRSCRVCSNRHGLIRKYGLNMCRQCFRQYAKDIGFVKLD
uniref:Small ribosomal subunit protein uS14 n=1 Tax=Amphiprion ocellaris TaxID=80972 RepID=A0AAQ5ZUB4_AMPOC